VSDQQEGFEIKGRFYPWAEQMRLQDPLLVTQVTDLSYTEFLKAWQRTIESMNDPDSEDDVDPIIFNGLVAVAIWQQNPEWSRARVVRFMEHLSQDDLEVVGGDEVEEEDKQTDPLSDGDSGSTESVSSSTTPSSSNGSPDSPSAAATRLSTGTSTSGMSSPE
jgi:hypothetical protein